jgi:hypothetical protein
MVSRRSRPGSSGPQSCSILAPLPMAVNRKTAKALGLEVPLSILLRATEVVE